MEQKSQEENLSDNFALSGFKNIYFNTDQTNETTHPKTVQPKSRFNKNIASLFLCCLKNAIKVGKK
jgi:hypothetical protein